MSTKKSRIEAFFGLCGFTIVTFWAYLLITSTFLFFIKIPVSEFSIYISYLLTIPTVFYFAKFLHPKYAHIAVLSMLFVFLSVVGLIFIQGKVYDLSYDGQGYHQEAVIQLYRGWNPVYTMLTNQATADHERWLNHYPKGVWIPQAAIYKLTGNIETGKLFTPLSAIAAFSLAVWGIEHLKIARWKKFLVVFLLIFNPIVITQTISFYLDGVLVSMLLGLVFILFRGIKDKGIHISYLVFFITVISANLKLSAPIFTAIFIGFFIFYLWVTDRLHKSLRFFKLAVLAFGIGMLFVGYNPYVTNFATYGHLFHPAMGRFKSDYTNTNIPEKLWNFPPPFRFLASMFSESSLSRGKGETNVLKSPFIFQQKEVNVFNETSVKLAGLGPLFSGALVISLAVFLFTKHKKQFLGIMIILLGTAALVPLSSVFRFVPFIWWVPTLALLFLFIEKSFISKMSAGVLIILLLANNVLISGRYFSYSIEESKKVEAEIMRLSQANIGPINIDVKEFGSTKIKLNTAGIEFNEISENSVCRQKSPIFPRSIAEICEF